MPSNPNADGADDVRAASRAKLPDDTMMVVELACGMELHIPLYGDDMARAKSWVAGECALHEMTVKANGGNQPEVTLISNSDSLTVPVPNDCVQNHSDFFQPVLVS